MHLILEAVAKWAEAEAMNKKHGAQWRIDLTRLAALCRKIKVGM